MSEPILEARDLCKSFGELTAVDEVNLSVREGEFVSVIGPNGAGKTTTFNLLSGALTPTSGTVVFKGQEITTDAPHERVQKGLGRSFQITNIFDGLTVRENVRLAVQAIRQDDIGLRAEFLESKTALSEVNARTDAVLEQSGLVDHAETVASSLSYGDRRRLEIGLVLATDPDLVLLDEPTAGMSVEETEATMDLITRVLDDTSVLLIEHDIDLVMRVSDRLTVLDNGSVLADGTPTEISNNEAVQRAYLGGGA